MIGDVTVAVAMNGLHVVLLLVGGFVVGFFGPRLRDLLDALVHSRRREREYVRRLREEITDLQVGVAAKMNRIADQIKASERERCAAELERLDSALPSFARMYIGAADALRKLK